MTQELFTRLRLFAMPRRAARLHVLSVSIGLIGIQAVLLHSLSVSLNVALALAAT